jgi:type II secretory pathway component GspD/PulD (secretin)
VAPAQARPALVQGYLNSAIDQYRRGDYERAAPLFLKAQESQADLTPAQRNDLDKIMALNNKALQAQREGLAQLRDAEQAIRAGRMQDAAALLRAVTANQFLPADKKQRAQQLSEQLHPGSVAKVPLTGTGGTPPLALARGKLQQARILMDKGDYDAAAALAREAELLGAVYDAREDTPVKVHNDIEKIRSNPSALMATARVALQNGDLDKAERLAHQAEAVSSVWNRSLQMWGDSPSKVLKDVQAARAKAAVAATVKAKGTTQVAAQAKLVVEPAAATATVANTDKARDLLKLARKSLQSGDFAHARKLAEQARVLKPELNYWEDTPDKLLNDVQRAEAAKQPTTVLAGNTAVSKSAPTATAESKTTDPRVLLRQGRELYQAGKYDEAKVKATAANASPAAKWGLFEDSPEKLLRDLAKRDQENSHKVLAEARKKFEQGDLDSAEKLTDRAERMHGPYSIWDFGDRPQKLRAEIDVTRAKNHTTKLPPPLPGALAQNKPSDKAAPATPPAPGAVAQNQPVVTRSPATTRESAFIDLAPRAALAGSGPAAAVAPVVTLPSAPSLPTVATVNVPGSATLPKVDDRSAQARQKLAEARLRLREGNATLALQLAGEVELMGVRFDQPGEDSPATLRRDCELSMKRARDAAADAAKQQVKQLLAEAHRLQADGRLCDARLKALEAQKLGAAYGPNEERPEQVLQQLSFLCYKRVEVLMQQAGDQMANAAADPARCQKAEHDLTEARQLAGSFGLDVRPIDEKMNVVRQARDRSAVAQAPPATNAQGPSLPAAPAMASPVMAAPALAATNGAELLEKARLELRSGNTETARRLAVEAYSGPAAVRPEAEALLRSIDAEEFSQRVLEAKRSFDAGVGYFNRRDYAQAASILHAVDLTLLEPDKQARYREIMQTPEMRPQALTLVSAKTPAGSLPGTAHASDAAGGPPASAPLEESLAQRTRAMQEIKFQQLRTKGLEVQTEALQRFQAGDTDRALELLQDYLARLREAQLEPERLALLQRPVDSRLQQFKMLKVQADYEKMNKSHHDAILDQRKREELAEENKKKQIAELMSQYRTFFKEAKYTEAEALAMRARELDPDDAQLSAAVYIAETQKNRFEANKAKHEREVMFVDELNNVEQQGPALTNANPLKVDKDAHDRAAKRRDYSQGLVFSLKNEKEREIERRLSSPVSLEFKDTPLQQVISDLRDSTGINIIPDKPALDEDGVSLARPISMKLEGVSLRSALNLLLHQVKLTYVIKEEVLQITTESHARERGVEKVYPVADLIVPVDNYVVPNSSNLTRVLENQNKNNNLLIGSAQPFQNVNAMVGGAPVGGSAASMTSVSPPAPAASFTSTAPAAGQRAPGQTMEDLLIKLITNTVAPQSWSEVGGPGTIDYYPLGMALVINQTPDIQEQIQELLNALRRLQDLEVSVEVRLINLSESFFERIGIDFNINILTKNNEPTESQLVTGNFAPPFTVNAFQPKNFLSGLTTPGSRNGNFATYTGDLNIPIAPQSFAQALPPFGGYNSLASGLDVGLAFLSDIQVFMFMEAAQGDRRTNIMQAPKLTMFNGQAAVINIQDNQFFVTSVTVAQSGGQVVFVPQNTPFPLGVFLALQPVVSADRRFVRMNLQPQLTNLTSALVPLFPITTFITPVFEGGAIGQPTPFTQFLQQPSITSINVQTTVSVPDGGTVLLGGLKLMNEGRNEFGPPFLSKIPYLNRLFKNVGYGRDTSSLLIMVTPRVIINEEEEVRQIGSAPAPTPSP